MPQEIDKLVREVMRHLIFRMSEKPGVPVARGDLTKITSTQNKVKGGYIIKLAQQHFSAAMGLELKELKVPTEKDMKQGAGAAHPPTSY